MGAPKTQEEAEAALLAAADRTISLFRRTRPFPQTAEGMKRIESVVERYVAALAATSGKRIDLRGFKFHSYAEWASVRDSVWDSVWASVWDSVRASVWASVRDSAFESEMEVLALAAVLHGLDKDGIGHLIMPTEDELNALALEKVAA